MKLTNLENMKLKNQTYFTLHMWRDTDKMGETYPMAYFRKKCADNRMNKLIEAGYKTVIMRKEEVDLRTCNEEISISSPVDIWENNMRSIMISFKVSASYIDCDYILYIDREGNTCMHSNLNDYESLCNTGLWRDGSFGNALIKLHTQQTQYLHIVKDHKLIMIITDKTPRELYYREATDE